MAISLKVKPEVLISKAGELSANQKETAALIEQAREELASVAGIWKSAASDEYQNRFKKIYDDIENMFTILSGHINELNEAAGVYSAAEKTAMTTAEGLPTDGVFLV